MAPRKRAPDEMESSGMEPREPTNEIGLLDRIRNMWEFACVMQYIFIFGKVVKIDEDFGIEDFETECLSPDPSDKLEEIGLTLLKWISSHRGLTLDNWDEYTRRQYLAKSPQSNPYGTEEQPRPFRSFDIFQKIRVLHQLTVWTFWNPDRLRERMPEQKETDQTLWRVEELGWDREERSYYVLDDSRLYRRTEPPLPAAPKAKPKANTLKAQAARRRANKRRRVETSETPELKDEESMVVNSKSTDDSQNGDSQLETFGGYKWECVAVTSEKYQGILKSIEKSRDPNEKDLHLRIVEQVLPVVEKTEESYRRKLERKQRELLNVQRLSGAKRSSRLADKHQRERQEREAIEAAEKQVAELAAAHREQERQAKMEQDRQSRMMTRDQRIKDREYKRVLHEEELARVAEEAKRVEAGEARGSERHLKAQMEKHKRDLEDLSADEDWIFDCSGCGVHGKNVDDGAHSVACEKCSIWQHSKCLGIRQIEAEKEYFHFICKDCKERLEDAKRPNIKLKFRAGLSSSPPEVRGRHPTEELSPAMKFKAVEIPAQQLQNVRPPGQGQRLNRPSNSPRKVANGVAPSPYLQHAASNVSNGHSADQTNQTPDTHRSSGSASTRSSAKPHATYPYPSNPPHHQSAAASAHTRHHQFNSLQFSSQNLQDSQPSSRHNTNQHSDHRAQQPQSVSRQQSLSVSSTPQTRTIPSQAPYGVIPSPNPQREGRLPSPVLNRPLMSPTQGNPDVAVVAGVPQRSTTSTSMSQPPSQTVTNQRHSSSAAPPFNRPYQSTAHINGELHDQVQSVNINHSQHQHLSGLSPTKNSPSLPPPPTPSTAHNAPSPPPPLQSAPVARSVSGTPIFPPTEMLQPSPKQLSKSPVPTPSKAMTPAGVGEGEVKRISEEVRDKVEEVTKGSNNGHVA